MHTLVMKSQSALNVRRSLLSTQHSATRAGDPVLRQLRRKLCIPLILMVLALVGSVLPVSPTGAAAAWTVERTTAVSHGLRISMAVRIPDSVPRSALLLARVTVTDESNRSVMLSRPCDRSNPRAIVTNGRGTVVYTTVRTFPVNQPCVARPPIQLAPGESSSRQNYVVMRGPVLLPVVDLRENGRVVRVLGRQYGLMLQPGYLTSRAAATFVGGTHLELGSGRGRVPLYRRRRLASLVVEARAPGHGPLVAIGSALCPGRRVLIPTWTVIARTGSSAPLPVPCARPQPWVIDYGWVGQSIAEITAAVGSDLPGG